MGRISQRSLKRAGKEFDLYFKINNMSKTINESSIDFILNEIDNNNTSSIYEIIIKAKEIHKKEIIKAVEYGNSFKQGDLICEIYYSKNFE